MELSRFGTFLVNVVFFSGAFVYIIGEDAFSHWKSSFLLVTFQEYSQQLWRIWTVAAGVFFLQFLFSKPTMQKDKLTQAYENTMTEMEKPRPNGKALARAYQSRKAGKIPPAYPSGWYHICYSQELLPGQVKYIQYLGEHLALFRTESGTASILDAYCPHLGANLAVSGTVIGENLQCPFHGWEFGEDGKCTNIPYCDTIPKNAQVYSWPICEKNGSVFMHYSENKEAPKWEIPELESIASGSICFHHGMEDHVEAHIQEIPENGSDTAHLNFLHTPFNWGIFQRICNLFLHNWTCSPWMACEAPEEQHLAKFRVSQVLTFLGKPVPFSTIIVNVTQTGPGYVMLEAEHGLVGKFVILQTVTPIGPLYQRVTHSIFSARTPIHRFATKHFLNIFAEMFERDVLIWRNKTYQHKPLLVKGDGNIQNFRRWYRQFYPIPKESDVNSDFLNDQDFGMPKEQRMHNMNSISW